MTYPARKILEVKRYERTPPDDPINTTVQIAAASELLQSLPYLTFLWLINSVCRSAHLSHNRLKALRSRLLRKICSATSDVIFLDPYFSLIDYERKFA